MVQEILKIACQRGDDSVTLPPQLRETLVLLLAAAPKGSELVRDVVAAIEQGLGVACNLSALPELVLSLLQLPDVCLVSCLCVSASLWDKQCVLLPKLQVHIQHRMQSCKMLVTGVHLYGTSMPRSNMSSPGNKVCLLKAECPTAVSIGCQNVWTKEQSGYVLSTTSTS